jgi:hypothetical protein
LPARRRTSSVNERAPHELELSWDTGAFDPPLARLVVLPRLTSLPSGERSANSNRAARG